MFKNVGTPVIMWRIGYLKNTSKTLYINWVEVFWTSPWQVSYNSTFPFVIAIWGLVCSMENSLIICSGGILEKRRKHVLNHTHGNQRKNLNSRARETYYVSVLMTKLHIRPDEQRGQWWPWATAFLTTLGTTSLSGPQTKRNERRRYHPGPKSFIHRSLFELRR